ncbi:MAG: hypothetical protein H0V01_03515 [Bacteroidetes bacterium]|nr:hypothetical protein [Bacteroidota bacterium]HET6245544.1 hypothetical protein [Bacteroidia bacterium]
MENELKISWEELLIKLEKQFGADLDLQSILFLIGVQELGKGYRKFTKDEKVDVMHVAICTLLEPFGYYEYEGLDSDGWPHWKRNEKLPALTPDQQTNLMQQAVVDYFKNQI